MQTPTLALLLAALTFNLPAQGQSQIAKASKPSLHLNLATEDAQPAKVNVEIRPNATPRKAIKQMDDVPAGSAEMALSGIPDGDYFVFFSSPGYATQWRALTLKQGRGEPDAIRLKLFRKRYVVLRYVFNNTGGRDFSGNDTQAGRAAVAHWGSLPYFQQDWQVWQRSAGVDMFGGTPYLEFHRFSKGFGFAKVPPGAAFDDLKEAPAQAEYVCMNMKAEKGLTLFCRVEGNREDGLGYGKVVVEDITETPPAGIKVIEAP